MTAARVRGAAAAVLSLVLLLLGWGGPAAGQGSAGAPLQLVREPVRVVFWARDRGLAERTLRAAATPLRLPGLPGVFRVAGTVVLAPTPAHFDSLTHGAAPAWSAGVAMPGSATIVLPAYSSARTRGKDPIVALRHELVHLALNAQLPGRIPRWFDEGYATWASGEWDEGSGWEIRLALLRGAAPPLDSLALGWPDRSGDARLAYLLSASAVRFLAERSGPDAFAAFLRAWRARGSWDAALREVYRMTPTQLEREWRRMVRRRYGWLLALSQVGLFWAVVTGLVLLLGARRRRRNRERLAEMEAEERLNPPEEEFWLHPDEDPDAGEGGVDGEPRRE